MDGHCVRAVNVRSDESVSPALCVHTGVWLAGCCQLLCMDSQSKELSADDYQCSCHNPVCHRVNPSFWLTVWLTGAILHTYTKQQGADND